MEVYVKLKLKKKRKRNDDHEVSSYFLGGGDAIKKAYIWT